MTYSAWLPIDPVLPRISTRSLLIPGSLRSRPPDVLIDSLCRFLGVQELRAGLEIAHRAVIGGASITLSAISTQK